MKLDFKHIEKALLDYNAKSELKQAAIIMVRNIFKEAETKQCTINDVSHCFFYDNELNHIRQWFNTTIDQNQDKDIKKTEWELALKIHKYLNITPESRIVENCG